MRETTWFAESKSRIEAFAASLIGNSPPYADFSLGRLYPVNCRVYCDSIPYLSYLKRNFASTTNDSKNSRIVLFMDRHKTLEPLRDMGYDITNVTTPGVGLFDLENNTGLIAGIDEYGLLKSTVIGMQSRLLLNEGYFPIHAAAVRFGRTGVLLIGHHGAGKSTAMLNLITRGRGKMEIKVLTDDWAVAHRVDSGIVVHSVERRMSFSSKLVHENPELSLETIFRQNSHEGIDKAWVDVEEVFGPGSFIDKVSLDRVAVFSPINGRELKRTIARDELADLLVDSAYHMPDCGDHVVDDMRKFWNDGLQGVDCLQIDSRYSGKPKDVVYDEMLRIIAAQDLTTFATAEK